MGEKKYRLFFLSHRQLEAFRSSLLQKPEQEVSHMHYAVKTAAAVLDQMMLVYTGLTTRRFERFVVSRMRFAIS
jgi:hypothetical protein